MDRNDEYHVYSGFLLGLHIADSILESDLGYRCDEILEQLESVSGGDLLTSPSDDALLRRFPLSQNDKRFSGSCHPILARVAQIVIKWHSTNHPPNTARPLSRCADA